MNLLCWEGYETDAILGEFARLYQIETHSQTLLSDTQAAHALLDDNTLRQWDVLNINNPWIRNFLCPQNRIQTLDAERFSSTLDNLLPEFDRLSHWAYDDDDNIVGICQRFGAFNLVTNTKAVDQQSAEDQGFKLAQDSSLRFGILCYDDFNIFHICLGAGINPFVELDDGALNLFSTVATDWFSRSALSTDDHRELNRALHAREIDFYISGGVYTVSEARLAGHNHLRAVTPTQGCINGLGGIVFAEISSALNHVDASPYAQDFLQYIVQPDNAYHIATTPHTLNPVAQMANPEVLAKFSRQQLDAIQWETLSSDVERCAMYQIPPNHLQLQSRLNAARNGASALQN